MKNWLKWDKGRQGTGYAKMLLAIGKTWDCYLINYPAFVDLPAHKDPVRDGFRHYRLNIVLKSSKGSGGKFWSENVIWAWKRIVLFRPDINLHGMTRTETPRLVFSFGFLRKERTRQD